MEESISSVITEPLGGKSPEVNDEEYMLAMVTNDQEREDVSTTASDEAVNPRWLKVCKKRWNKKSMRTEA